MKKDKKAVILDNLRGRYVRGGRKEKSQLLDELCDLHGLNREKIHKTWSQEHLSMR